MTLLDRLDTLARRWRLALWPLSPEAKAFLKGLGRLAADRHLKEVDRG